MFADDLGLTNLFLHAEEINFIHPFTNEHINIIAEKPKFWKEFERIIDTKSI